MNVHASIKIITANMFPCQYIYSIIKNNLQQFSLCSILHRQKIINCNNIILCYTVFSNEKDSGQHEKSSASLGLRQYAAARTQRQNAYT